jgi:hypothetical protein
MLGEGLVDQAFTTAAGLCGAIYQDLGYWFRTPEVTLLSSIRHHNSRHCL